VLVAHDNLELLPADAVGLRPVAVVLLHYLPTIPAPTDSAVSN
jgi:hypothetical protein